MDSGVGGQIHGISLDSFLQMVQMERTTCTLAVKAGDRNGQLWLLEGEMIRARTGELENIEAALEILSWHDSVIEIENACEHTENRINQPLMEILTEGMRIRDEKRLDQELAGPAEPAEDDIPAGLGLHLEPEPMELDPPPLPLPPDDEAPAGGQTHPILTDDAPAAGLEIHPVLRAGARRQKRKLPRGLMLGACGALAILAGLVLLFTYTGGEDAEDAYFRTVNRVENIDGPAERKLNWESFTAAHPSGEFADLARNHIREADLELEKMAYTSVLTDVEALAVDSQYTARATDLYQRFLGKYPDGPHAERVQQKIREIPDRIDDEAFARARSAARNSSMEESTRIRILRDYLTRYPSGRHRDEVDKLLTVVGSSYRELLLTRKSICDAAKSWDDCIEVADRIVESFSGTALAAEITALRDQMKDSQDIQNLHTAARARGTDFEAARDIYLTYLKRHPDTSRRADIEKALEELESRGGKWQQWLEVETYARDRRHDVFARIERLEAYNRANPAGGFSEEAARLMSQLDMERQLVVMQRKEIRQQGRAREQRETIERRRKERQQRLATSLAAVHSKLKNTAGRFRANGNGTVSDQRSGLTWTTLDSLEDLGECVDYARARAWVRALQAGGYSDWRLPGTSELGALYKARPFFPRGDARWYWTSETHVKGYHDTANVVTSRPETVLRKKEVSQDECGAVRAVRP